MNTEKESGKKLSYLDSGVDIDAGAELVERIKPAVKSTLRPEVLSGLGGFGALFQLDLENWTSPVLVSGTDGVGTKLLLARELELHDSIGIDLVAMCVNDILVCGAEPLFFLDYYATGKLDLDVAESVISGIAEGCRQAGCSLIGGETAEMPGMYDAGDYDLAGFAVGMVERSEMLDGSRIKAGHRLLGLASSGPHSNGYSLIRKVIELSNADLSCNLTQKDGSELSLAEALLAPTIIYVKPVLELVATGHLDGLAHVTGGGLTENVVRVIPEDLGIVINPESWQRPPVFDWLKNQGNIDESEMLRTFNCGIGMVMMVSPEWAETLIQRSQEIGFPCQDIGYVSEYKSNSRVEYSTR